MERRSHPPALDTGARRQGAIAYIDRLEPDGRHTVAEDVGFDADRIDNPPEPAAEVPV